MIENPSESGDKGEPIFTVMPQEGKNYAPPPNLTAPKPGPTPPIGLDAPPQPGDISKPRSSAGRTWTYGLVIVLVLLALGGVAYYMLGVKKSTDQSQADLNKLPTNWIQKYFNSDTCSDDTVCGETADPDTDGMTNYEEFKAGTNPLNPDTDGDGLADGDEAKIFGTEPNVKYTDTRPEVSANDWTDGIQIEGGYDPINPGQKFNEVRKQKIKDDIAQFTLHEPSVTTLKGSIFDPTVVDTTGWNVYTNSKFGFVFSYPSNYKEVSSQNKLLLTSLKQTDDTTNSTVIDFLETDSNQADYLAIYEKSLTMVTTTKVTANDLNWSVIVVKDPKQNDAQFINASAEKNNKTYVFTAAYNKVNKDNINQIIKTFKFTSQASTTTPTPTPAPTAPQAKTVNAAIANGIFSPATVTINSGDTIVWKNNDPTSHLIASNPHPTHTDLPGFESSTLNNGQTYSFKFTKVGTWGYHDHLNPTISGTVIVK